MTTSLMGFGSWFAFFSLHFRVYYGGNSKALKAKCGH